MYETMYHPYMNTTTTKNKWNELNSAEYDVIENKHTEPAFTGEYDDFFQDGIFVCRRCGAELYSSDSKFHSGCGWPAFDNDMGNVARIPDPDGMRTEIVCKNCNGHLGHVFEGEGFTDQNTRHCVNSLSIKFIPKEDIKKSNALKEIILGGGCFWCIEAIFQQFLGIENISSGYTGGTLENPTYADICNGNTHHIEVVKVTYNPSIITLAQIIEIFLNAHDPTSLDKQGADTGEQYRSAIFFVNDGDLEIIQNEIKKYEQENNCRVVTECRQLQKFYIAEDSHQNYYNDNPNQGYCSIVIAPKVKKIREKYSHMLKQ